MRRLVGAVLVVAVGGMMHSALAAAEGMARPVGGADITDEAMGRYGVYPVIEKLARGISNFLGGWLEVPLGIHNRYSKTDTVVSMLAGFGTGVIKGVARTAVGVYEIVTFPVPYPEDYAPILPTLEYFRHADNRRPLPLE